MAKDATDTSADAPVVFTPADASDMERVLGEYEDLNESKKGYADKQKVLLDDFNRQHSTPPFVLKFLRKLKNMDQPDQGGAVRALLHGVDVLGLNDQTDMFDDVDTPAVAANDGAEQWPDDKAVAGNA